jgi:hypothetical protein
MVEAGSAGCVLAALLSQDPIEETVCSTTARQNSPMMFSDALWTKILSSVREDDEVALKRSTRSQSAGSPGFKCSSTPIYERA